MIERRVSQYTIYYILHLKGNFRCNFMKLLHIKFVFFKNDCMVPDYCLPAMI